VINLASWRHRMAELENLAPDNPFAAVILAQLTSRATEPDRHRLASKLHLARQLKKWRYDEDTRLVVFQLMDGLLTLPEPLDEDFFDHLDAHGDTDMMEACNASSCAEKKPPANWKGFRVCFNPSSSTNSAPCRIGRCPTCA